MIRGIYQIGEYNIRTIKSAEMANEKQLLKYCILIYITVSQQQVELKALVNYVLYKNVWKVDNRFYTIKKNVIFLLYIQ